MRRPQWIPSRLDAAGIVLAFAIGGIAVASTRVMPSSPLLSDVLVALLMGALLLNTPLARVFGLGPRGKEREPDRYASGLRFTGKWVLRLAIVLMGMKVQTAFFGKKEIALVAGVALVSVPSAFFVAHVIGAALRVRRPLVDLLAGGTMICGASAVNAIAPVAGAHREEQGVAIGVVFIFSVVAMFSFPALASALALSPHDAGLWSGLAVNDLASAVTVGAQMGEGGGVMATASKSARILLIAPVLVALAFARRDTKKPGAASDGVVQGIVSVLPGFLVGYVVLAIVRAVGDHAFAGDATWLAAIAANALVLDVLMAAVAACIGLHLSVRAILASSPRALAVGAGASAFIAGITLAMTVLAARGLVGGAVAVGVASLGITAFLFRTFANEAARVRIVERRFAAGELVTIEEATHLLDLREREGSLDDDFLRVLLDRLSPSIGELIPARTSPLAHGEGCRWLTYWEGRRGWALVAIVREPGATTPIHAHPHRLLGKTIEGMLEETRFRELGGGVVEVSSRTRLAHEELVETDGLDTLHVVRAVGEAPAIDLQMRGPEVGKPGRRLRVARDVDLTALAVGDRVEASEEIDDRPGHGGEGAGAGRLPPTAA